MFATWPVVLDLQGILRKKAPHEPPNYPEQSRVHVSHICVTSVSYDQSCMLKIANEGPQDWPWTFNAQTHPVYINYYTPRRTTSHFQDIAQFIPIDYILNVQTGRTKKKWNYKFWERASLAMSVHEHYLGMNLFYTFRGEFVIFLPYGPIWAKSKTKM